MTILDKLISKLDINNSFASSNTSSAYPNTPAPLVSAPWTVEWSAQDRLWLFTNHQTGERTFNYPGPGYQPIQQPYQAPNYYQGGPPPPAAPYNNYGNYAGYAPIGGYQQHQQPPPPPPPQQNGYYNNGGYQSVPQQQPDQRGYAGYDQPPPYQQSYGGYPPAPTPYGSSGIDATKPAPPPPPPAAAAAPAPAPEKKSSSNGLAYGAVGAAAGLAGGIFLAHEVHKAEDHIHDEEAKLESLAAPGPALPLDSKPPPSSSDDGASNLPEAAAFLAGESVGEIKSLPDKIENKWDHAVDDVENFPENAAGWVGEKVGEVEEFGDRMGDAYHDGEAEGRYGDGGLDDDDDGSEDEW